jgi:hypothetical protein
VPDTSEMVTRTRTSPSRCCAAGPSLSPLRAERGYASKSFGGGTIR